MDNNVNSTTGTLYIVATPIGNLEDITARALKTLNELFFPDFPQEDLFLKVFCL